jgi:hypothetical protein
MRVTVGFASATAVLLGSAACGSDEGASDDTPVADDSGATPVVHEADLSVLAGWDAINPDATGSAVATVDEDGTSVELVVSGLEPDTEYTSHVHDASCADEFGGGHWLADPAGEDAEPNIIQLSLTTDADGAGSVTVDSEQIIDDRALSLVVHAGNHEEHAEHVENNRILCGDLSA